MPLEAGSQSTAPVAYKPGAPVRIAYMPPATEFNYYMAIGEGIKTKAAELGVETFMLAPQSGSDIATQMKMLQDVTTQGVDAIILSTHDENAAAPLVKQAIDKGIAVVIVNSDIASFPTPVNAVVGYGQRKGTKNLGEYAAKMVNGKANVGVLEGLPGYHSTERIGGFLDAFKNYPDMKIIATLPTEWNVETGNKAMMDMIQAHPEINLVVTANDYIAIGAAKAAEALGRKDILIFGNDGDTTGLEDIAAGRWTATQNTTPFVMGKVALMVAMDVLNGKFPGGWVETPSITTDKNNVLSFLCHPEELYPKPSKEYACPEGGAAPTTTEAPTSEYVLPEGAVSIMPLEAGSQSTAPVAYKPGAPVRIAYMPPATEFNYYMAIGEGIKTKAAELGVETFMLAPQSGSDIATQMKMLQDVTTQGVDAIILSTHDENAAAPLVKQAIDKGIAVVIVNSDIASFPTPVNAVVGYGQRKGTKNLGEYAAKMVNGKANVGVLEGLPGYHSTERIGGFLDAFKNYPDMKIIATLPTEWNVETGNKAMMDMIQAHPEINLVVTANDYIAIGAAKAAEALGRKDILIFGNDGDTTGLEDIAAGRWTATQNTTPFVMGKVALMVAMDVLNGIFPGGWVETPSITTDKNNVLSFLCHPEELYPKPSMVYTCP
jgi:ribose transport system substrate-binding protein